MPNLCEKRIIEISGKITETGKLQKNTYIIALVLAVGLTIALIPIGRLSWLEKLRWLLGFWLGVGTALINFHLLVRATEALAASVEGQTIDKPKRYMLKGFFLRYLLMGLALVVAYFISTSALFTAAVGLLVVPISLVICQLVGATRAGG